MRAWGGAVVVLFALVVGSLSGCASLKTVFAPRPAPTPPSSRTPAPAPAPPPAPAAPKEEAPPAATPRERVQPPVLSPKVSAEDVERMKLQSSTRIQQTEEIIKPIDQARLTKNQQDTYATIQSFLAGAREALTAQDYLRASNLADKAHVLAEELSRGLK